MHSRQAFIDNDDIPYMQSQPSSRQSQPLTIICIRRLYSYMYLASTHSPKEEEFNTNRPSSPARRGRLFLPANLNSKKNQYIPVIPIIRRIILNFFFLLHMVFPNLGFHVLCLHLFSVLCFTFLHLHRKHILSFYGVD